MAIVVEDGTIVSGANSYVTEAELDSYAGARGITISAGQQEEDLIKAMDVIEYIPLPGIKYTKAQPLQWPREGVVIDGFDILVTEIPDLLKEVQYEAAIAIDTGYDPLAIVTRVKESVSVGSISVKYANNSPDSRIYTPLWNKVARLLSNNPNNGFEFEVSPA